MGDGPLSKIYRLVFTGEDREESNTQTASLAGLAIVLAVLVVALFLFKSLAHTARIEDCMMQGRTNCDLLVPKLR
jgi:hypothetical protein